MALNFVTFDMLNKLLLKNLHRIPHDIDVVVGVPRSGLLLANMIACYLNKPLTDVAGVIAGKFFDAGNTKNKIHWARDFSTVKKILVVEDSVASGASINQVKRRLALINVEKIYLAASVEQSAINTVDLYFAVVPQPRMFEWNFMHHTALQFCCIDFDGVLCQDPTPEQNDDGENYRNFILNAAPKFIPSQPVGCIVTARLKKYARETQLWLQRHNVRYGSLIMLNLDSAAQRRKLGIHAQFKAQVYGSIEESFWFIESDPNQAREIAQLSGKPVYCVSNSTFYAGGVYLPLANNFFVMEVLTWLRQYCPPQAQVDAWAAA